METTIPALADSSAGPRDAKTTRERLLAAGSWWFSHCGYGAATTRAISREAGVNVALIARYFGSKAGLYEACLSRAVDVAERVISHFETGSRSSDEVTIRVLAEMDTSHEFARQVAMMLEPSGDPRLELLRRDAVSSIFATFTATIHAMQSRPPSHSELLRAQMGLAAVFGLALIRATATIEPLGSVCQRDLDELLHV